MKLFLIFFSAFLVNNIVLIRFLGLCPFFGVSKRIDTAISMGMAVLFVMVMSTWITWAIYNYLLLKFNLIYLRTASFILTIAVFVQIVEMIIKKQSPELYNTLGIYLPLITTNCTILGTTFLVIDQNFSFIESTIFAIGTAIGFTIVIILMSGIRENLEIYPIPKALRGIPIALITASLMSLAFLGFIGFLGLSI